ncbi:hypothetical protein AAC387_Pa10g1259 [Persea americana]
MKMNWVVKRQPWQRGVEVDDAPDMQNPYGGSNLGRDGPFSLKFGTVVEGERRPGWYHVAVVVAPDYRWKDSGDGWRCEKNER